MNAHVKQMGGAPPFTHLLHIPHHPNPPPTTTDNALRPVTAAVKKTGHTRANTPFTTTVIGIPSRAYGLQVLGDFGHCTSDTSRGHFRTLGPEEVEAWLGIGTIDGVKYTGHYRSIGNTVPKIHVSVVASV